MAKQQPIYLGVTGMGSYVLVPTLDGFLCPRVTLTPHRLMGVCQRPERRQPAVELGTFDAALGRMTDMMTGLLDQMGTDSEAIVRAHVAQTTIVGGPSPLDRLKALVARLEGAR